MALIWAIFIVDTFFILIIMVNVVRPLMQNTFNKILTNVASAYTYEIGELVRKFEDYRDGLDIDKHVLFPKYVFILHSKTLEEV